MWPFIRIFVSLFITFETMFAGIFNGIPLKGINMPEAEVGEYTQHVDPFIGTGGTPWTAGMLSPAATVPFGAVRLGPDTSFIGGAYIVKTNTSGYYYEHGHIKGFSHSRLSGTGAEDYQMFRVTPAIGSAKAGVMPYSHAYETAVPGYYALYLQSIDCLAEFTADIHTGVHRYTFFDSSDARLYIDITSCAGNRSAGKGKVSVDENGMIIPDFVVTMPIIVTTMPEPVETTPAPETELVFPVTTEPEETTIEAEETTDAPDEETTIEAEETTDAPNEETTAETEEITDDDDEEDEEDEKKSSKEDSSDNTVIIVAIIAGAAVIIAASISAAIIASAKKKK